MRNRSYIIILVYLSKYCSLSNFGVSTDMYSRNIGTYTPCYINSKIHSGLQTIWTKNDAFLGTSFFWDHLFYFFRLFHSSVDHCRNLWGQGNIHELKCYIRNVKFSGERSLSISIYFVLLFLIMLTHLVITAGLYIHVLRRVKFSFRAGKVKYEINVDSNVHLEISQATRTSELPTQ